MLTPLPFALHASQACVPHAELALSLAAAFHEVDADEVEAAVERLAGRLSRPPSRDPLDELHALEALLADPAMPVPVVGSDICCLMLDDALDQGAAHPLIRAVIAVEVGRRHGMAVGLVSNGHEHCVGHERLDGPLLLRCDSDEIVDAHTLSGTLQWQCSHETCGLLLDELEQRWLLWMRIDDALHAADLRLRLPLDDEAVQTARLRLEHVRSRLN
jgi:hypothetical protein